MNPFPPPLQGPPGSLLQPRWKLANSQNSPSISSPALKCQTLAFVEASSAKFEAPEGPQFCNFRLEALDGSYLDGDVAFSYMFTFFFSFLISRRILRHGKDDQ
jgi:hypothetical protein